MHVLVVADWAVDPHGVIAACRRRAAEGEVAFAFVVPAWLHGLDWAGDPHASRPCAGHQVERLLRLARAAGLCVVVAEVGDPDPTSAIEDARADRPVDEILLCGRIRRFHHPLDLAHRVRRATRLTVREVGLRRGAASPERHGLGVFRKGGHCAVDLAQVA